MCEKVRVKGDSDNLAMENNVNMVGELGGPRGHVEGQTTW